MEGGEAHNSSRALNQRSDLISGQVIETYNNRCQIGNTDQMVITDYMN